MYMYLGTKIPDTDEPVEAEYGDTSGAMGFVLPEGYARCFNGPHAVQLGWVTPSLSLVHVKLRGTSIVAASLSFCLCCSLGQRYAFEAPANCV